MVFLKNKVYLHSFSLLKLQPILSGSRAITCVYIRMIMTKLNRTHTLSLTNTQLPLAQGCTPPVLTPGPVTPLPEKASCRPINVNDGLFIPNERGVLGSHPQRHPLSVHVQNIRMDIKTERMTESVPQSSTLSLYSDLNTPSSSPEYSRNSSHPAHIKVDR